MIAANDVKVVCVDDIDAYKSCPSQILDEGLILTLDISVAARAKREKRNVLSIVDLFPERNLFFLAKESLSSSKNISSRLSDRIGQLDFDLTGVILYPIKITIDTIMIYSKLIQAVDDIINPSSITGLNPPKVRYNNHLLIDSSFPLLSYVAKNLSDTGKITASFVAFNSIGTRSSAECYFSFGQPRLRNIRGFLSPFVKKIHHSVELSFILLISFILSFKLNNKKRVLSVGSREVNTKSTLSRFIKFPDLLKINSEFTLSHHENLFPPIFKSDVTTEVEHVNIQQFIDEIAKILVYNEKKMRRKYFFVSLIIKIFRPHLIVVQTASVFNLLSVFAIEASRRLNLKTFCWMHGGYGAYTSLPGYDVTDFYSVSGHLLYGNGASDTILSENSILRELYPNRIYETYIMGSPFIEKTYKKIKKVHFNKDKLVFVLPGAFGRNAYYIGYDRDYDFLNYQECVISILQVLSKYSNKYDIVVKDYPSGFYEELFKEDYPSLRYISSETSFYECVSDAGAIIYPWVSTSFIEGIFTDANILLFDPSSMNDESARILNEGCFLFETDLQSFLKKFENILRSDNFLLGFPRADNEKMRSYFIKSVTSCSDNYSKIFEINNANYS